MPDRPDLTGEAAALAAALEVRVVVHGEVDSTMDEAERDRGGRPVVHLAASQRAGRGRRGRRWRSPPGNLYATVAWPDPDRRLPPGILAAVQLAWAEAVAAAGGPRLACKWPNDGLVEGLKWAGTLAVRGSGPAGEELRLGLGANLAAAPAGPGPAAAALAPAWPGWPGRVEVQRLLLAAALEVLAEGEPGVAARLARWPGFDALAPGETIAVRLPAGERRGAYAGVDAGGRLRLRTPAGIEALAAGEVVRVRPV